MANGDNEVKMMMSVVPGAMTGFAALNAGMSSILNVFNSFTRSFDAQFGLMDAAITTTSFVVTQLGADAMHAFGEFEQGMKIVQMVSGQTAQDMEFLKQKANDFSVQYRLDIDQITEGLQTLGRAGLNSASEQTEVLQAGLNTAKLEGRDLNAILQELIQNTSLLGGDLKSSEFGESSQYVNDLLVATSMTAPITTHDVSETLKYSGGIAAAAGANIETEQGKAILEDYMGAIAAFAQKGVTGSIAGTALRAFLNKPATQDSSVTEALASIKLKPEYLWEDGEETMKPISEQIDLIQKQMDKLDVSKMDRLQIWSKIVGGKMGQQMMKLDSESIKEVTKDIQAADSASNLAAGSMKTFEANVKQVSEQGQVLQRNVGEKLVFFANPILELINKVTEFLGQDGMSWPLTAGVLTAVSILTKRIVQVFNVAKTELGSLLSMGREALAIHVGKHGYAKWEEDKDTAEEKTSTKTSVYPSKSSEIKATTLKNFDKEYSKISSATDKLSVSAMKAAGISDQNIALAGRFSSLTKQIPIAGTTMTEGSLWGAAIKHNLLTSEEMSLLQRGYSGGMSGRPLGDLLGKGYIQTIVPRIESLSLALKDLGLSAQSAATASEESASQIRLAYQAPFNKSKSDNWKTVSGLADERKKQAAIEAQAHAMALGEEVVAEQEAVVETTAASESIIMNTRNTVSVVESEFLKMSSAVSTAVSGMGPKVSSAYSMLNWNKLMGANVVGPFTSVDPKPFAAMPGYFNQMGANFAAAQQFLMNYYFPPGLDQLREELGIPKKPPVNPFAKGGMFYDETRGVYVSNYGDLNKDMSKTPPTHVGPTNHLMGPIIQGQYTLDEKGRIITNPYPLGATNVPLPNTTPRMPGYAGNLPSEAEIRASNINNEAKQAEIKASQQNAAAKQEEIAKIDQEIAAKQAEIDSAYTDAEAAARDAEAFAANAAAVDRMTAAASTFAAFLEGRFTGTPVTKGSGNGIWSIGLSDKQKQDLKDVHSSADERAGKRSRIKIDSPVGLVSQSEAQRFRDEAKQQVASAKAARDFRPTSSLLSNAIGKYGNTIPTLDKAANNYRIATENANVINRTLTNPLITGSHNLVGNPNYDPYSWRYKAGQLANSITSSSLFHPIAAIESSGFYQNLTNRLNRDRTGSFFSFGKEERFDAAGKSLGFGSATKGLKGIGNKLLNATDMIGGPFMIAIMAATTAIQLLQKEFQNYCEDLKEAGDKLKEAYSNWNTAEDDLERTYREGNPDATDEEIDQMIYNTYSTMQKDVENAIKGNDADWLSKLGQNTEKSPEYEYDEESADGTVKEKKEELTQEEEYTKAVKENTGALYAATYEVNQALNNYVRISQDSWWGADGWVSKLSDALGGFVDKLTHIDTFGSTFTDNGNDFLLTASQKDENYSGYTEMAGLMLEDFKDARGNWVSGMKTMMGTDAVALSRALGGQNSAPYKYLTGLAKFSAGQGIGGLNSTQNAKIQQSMKNDPKTWKSLAKELAKRDTSKKYGKDITKNQNRIRNLTERIRQTIGNGFKNSQIQRAAYIQQLQDMKAIADQAIVPIMQTNLGIAGQTLSATNNVGTNTGNTVNTTGSTNNNAAIIAGLVAIIARQSAKQEFFDTVLAGGESGDNDMDGSPGTDTDKYLYEKAKEDGMTADKFYQENVVDYNEYLKSRGSSNESHNRGVRFDWMGEEKKGGMQGYLSIIEATAKMTGYNYSKESAKDAGREFAKDMIERGVSLDAAFSIVDQNYTMSQDFKDAITNAYLSAQDEEEGGSGGSGSGSGSGDNDKDQGTKKERVDLVLCNKKEIPKLNVNLFKKPPTFTVLNKNFKLRDVKINTEDKPKAIMASIKNAFIDVQKRSDPKIIQDEEAEYDPVGATDGNALPSGSSRPKTNNNS